MLSLFSSDEEESKNSETPKTQETGVVCIEPVHRTKEPVMDETVTPYSDERIQGGELDLEDIVNSPDVERALLVCRTVRIGSYKTVPEGKVTITEYGLYFKVPAIETKEMVTVKLFKDEIVKVLGNFGKTCPLLFYYTTAGAAEKIRRVLQMSSQERGPYYDPTSSVERHRGITLLPERISEETRLFLKWTYNPQYLLEKLTKEEANAILAEEDPSVTPVESQPVAQSPSRGKDNVFQTPVTAPSPAASCTLVTGPPRDLPMHNFLVSQPVAQSPSRGKDNVFQTPVTAPSPAASSTLVTGPPRDLPKHNFRVSQPVAQSQSRGKDNVFQPPATAPSPAASGTLVTGPPRDLLMHNFRVSQPVVQSQSRGKDNVFQTPAAAPSPALSGTQFTWPPSDPPIQTIMVYPPPPAKGGISINTEDYFCLSEGSFLNDVIIDFYMKYFVQEMLSPFDQSRTHVFSSFFYQRLTTRIPPRPGDKQSAAERRHKNVRSWTKQVDLFSKDFVIIPINDNHHWLLGVVCFPGLTHAVRTSDCEPVPNPSKRRAGRVDQKSKTPIIPARSNQQDRDEADADENDLEPNDDVSDDEPCDEAISLLDDVTYPIPKIKVKKELLDPIKQPCILIFDSFAGASRSKICATLREYIQVEYDVKHSSSKGKRVIDKNTMKATVVKVPQQTNYTDCGLYVLQYMEAFFQSPITDYRMPIKQLVNWFDIKIVDKKRHEILLLLHKLMAEQNIDTRRLNLTAFPEGTGKVFTKEEIEMMEVEMDVNFEVTEEDDAMMAEEEIHRSMLVGNSSPLPPPPQPTLSTPQPDNIRSGLRRKEVTISPSVASSISITSTSASAAPKMPSKLVAQPVSSSATPIIPQSIPVTRKLLTPDSSTSLSTSKPSAPQTQNAIPTTSATSVGSGTIVKRKAVKGGKRKRIR